jgi:multidrug efflux pump subunit AcrB
MSDKHVESIYLERLEYDPALENSWFRFFLDRSRFIFLLILIIAIAGFLSLRSLPLESNPEVQIGIGVVITTLPGASPQVMEDLVTKKIETEVSKIKGIDTMSSTSRNSVSSITVQFKSDVEIATAMRDLKDKVDLAKSKLPEDAKDPIVQEVSFDDTPIWTFSIAGPYDGFQLYHYAKLIKDELEKNALVSEVNISGGDETEFGVALDPAKLEHYGLSVSAVNSVIQGANLTLPIGDFDIDRSTHVLTIDERYYTANELQNLVVAKSGTTGVIRLRDIATVEQVPKKRTTLSRLSDGGSAPEPAATLGVVKKSGGSIVNLISEGEVALAQMQASGTLPANLRIVTIQDNAERIKLDLEHLIRDGLLTVLLVFVTLFLVIGVKEALVAGTSAPLVFLVTFTVMAIAGQTLNFLSMFALILSLGLLVDDAIVVISAINQYRRTEKFTTRQAALLVLRDYRMVLISTTLTVVWIFSAMLFMTGIIGKFIFSIPFIITVTLLASLVIALTINPSLALIFDRIGGSKRHGARWSQIFDKGFISIVPLENLYARTITRILSSRRFALRFVGAVGVLFVLSLLMPITGLLKSEFFPKTDQDIFAIDIEAEAGTKLDVTSDLVKPLEDRLRKETEVKNFSTSIGSASNLGGNGGTTSASNYANITVNLVKKEEGRKESSMEIAERLRQEFAKIRTAKVTVAEQAGGPPAGADFEVQIVGDDFTVMDRIVADTKKTLSEIPGAINITTSRKPLPLEFRFAMDDSKLAVYNLSMGQVAMFLKNAIDGVEATKIYKGTDEIVVRTRYAEDSVDSIDKIKNLKIVNSQGQAVFIRDIVSNELQPSVFGINREDQKRIVKVSASADKTTNSTKLLEDFNAKTANYKMPSGYSFKFGGANEENTKSVQSLLVAMVFGMFLIVATLVILFDSYKQAVLVLVTIPLSLIGVFFGLALFMQPLSFPGLIGLVALFGIVVRNGIILFDKINLNLREGIPFMESIIDAGKTRLEPVVLTSVCTILGMIPLTFSSPTWTSLGLSIIFGLSVSTLFTLLVLPTLYFLFIKDKRKPTGRVVVAGTTE